MRDRARCAASGRGSEWLAQPGSTVSGVFTLEGLPRWRGCGTSLQPVRGARSAGLPGGPAVASWAAVDAEDVEQLVLEPAAPAPNLVADAAPEELGPSSAACLSPVLLGGRAQDLSMIWPL
ncbi:hypothetical protein F6X54_11185 [Micromonospora aurantiaca]|uniref:Uncharacterized protein n=1 Tax=Micromonospora aurantiaca (nom. illeg.) TaxID=47850 RepID=A0A3M9KC30_9ACTN|nr:hypothetical protein DVH21_29430 [Micromonospora aurantiaca]KAB1116613.1 hypothetical protein F6X54_11185 [Micromonospora aurantiaca]RNH97757.1 hypothetical protein EEZ25_29535 [Micromonospora aurantiaca]